MRPTKCDNASVAGIDIAPNLIAEAQANAARERLPIALEVGDAERLPYGTGAFQTVVLRSGPR